MGHPCHRPRVRDKRKPRHFLEELIGCKESAYAFASLLTGVRMIRLMLERHILRPRGFCLRIAFSLALWCVGALNLSAEERCLDLLHVWGPPTTDAIKRHNGMSRPRRKSYKLPRRSILLAPALVARHEL